MIKVSKLTFQENYSDDSGIEFKIELDKSIDDSFNGSKGRILFQRCCQEAEFPLDKLDWIIDCLNKIKKELGVKP